MTNHNFENKISEKLNQFEIEPSEGLIDSIFEKRAGKSKNVTKIPFAKLAIFASIIAATSFLLFNYFGDKKQSIDYVNKSENEILNKVSVAYDKDKTDIAADNNINKNSNIISNNNGPVKLNKTSYLTTNMRKSKSNKKTTTENIIDKTPISPEIEITNNENLESRYFNILNKNRPIIENEQHKGKSHLYVYQTVSESSLANLNLNTLMSNKLKKITLNKITFNTIEQLENRNKISTLKPSKKPIFIDILFSPSLSFFKTTDKLNNNYRSLNKSNYNQQFGLRVSVPITNRLNVFSGVNFKQQENLYKGSISSNENYTTIKTLTGYINDPIKGVIPFYYQDTTYINRTVNTNCNFRNTYKLIQIPLGISYNWGFKKFDFSANLSSLFNVYSNSQGNNIDFTNSKTTGFSNNNKHFGLGVGISFMSAYKLNNKLKLIIEPGFNFYKIKAQRNANQMNESVYNNLLTVGLRYNLF